MRNCFIPGCDRFCRNEGTVKRKMFVVPKDREEFEAWVKILPKNRELKAHDKVCERHFNEEDISTTYDNNINGLIYKMERGRAKLKPKAIPSRNMECFQQSPKRKKTSVLFTTNKIRVVETQGTIEIHTSQIPTDLEEQQLEIDGEVQDINEIPLKDPNIVSYEVTAEVNDINEIQMPEAQVQELFESLYDDIYEVVLPNTLWGVHRCPEHSSIFFSFVDPSMLRTTKMISISSQGDIKILLGSRLISEQSLMAEVNSIESLSDMIAEIDEVLLCSKMFENEFCEVSLKNTSTDVCEPCSQFEHL